VIAVDIPRFLQRADAAQAGGRGNTGQLGQFDVRDSAIILKVLQDLAIDLVEFNALNCIDTVFVYIFPERLIFCYKIARFRSQTVF
jgi:hypothetical protein